MRQSTHRDFLPEDQEGILYADLDPEMLILAKAAADPAGHYARADAVRLVVNRKKRVVMEEIEVEDRPAQSTKSGQQDDGDGDVAEYTIQ